MGVPNFDDMIADETVGITEDEILPLLQEKGHPALTMPPIMGLILPAYGLKCQAEGCTVVSLRPSVGHRSQSLLFCIVVSNANNISGFL